MGGEKNGKVTRVLLNVRYDRAGNGRISLGTMARLADTHSVTRVLAA